MTKKMRLSPLAMLFCIPLLASSCFVDADDDDGGGDPEECRTACEDTHGSCVVDCDDADDACRLDCNTAQTDCFTDCD